MSNSSSSGGGGSTRGGMKVMRPIFFSENVIAITMKFTWMIHASFAITRLFSTKFPSF
jgi:hypothetical protein